MTNLQVLAFFKKKCVIREVGHHAIDFSFYFFSGDQNLIIIRGE